MRPPAGEIPVPNGRAGVGVSFDAMAFHQEYVALRRLAEMMPAVGGHGDDRPFESDIVHPHSQAARAKESPLLAKVSHDLGQRHRVQDAVGRYAPLARHLHAPVQCMWSSSRIEWASGLMVIMQP